MRNVSPMVDLGLLLALHAAVSVTEIVQPHREPAPPAVIPRHFGKRQGLAYLALIAEATGAVMALAPTLVLMGL